MKNLNTLVKGVSVAAIASMGVTEAFAQSIPNPHRVFIYDTNGGITVDKAGYVRDARTGKYVAYNQGPTNEDQTCVWKLGPQGMTNSGYQVSYNVTAHPRAGVNACCDISSFNVVAAATVLMGAGLHRSTVTPPVTGADADRVRLTSNVSGCSRSSAGPSSGDPGDPGKPGGGCQPTCGGGGGGGGGGGNNPEDEFKPNADAGKIIIEQLKKNGVYQGPTFQLA